MKKQIVVVGALALLFSATFFKPAQANPVVPECKNIPTCIVVGTVVVGGIVYYVIKNTVTGVVQRVPAKQMPPAQSDEQYEEKLVNTTTKGKSCEEIASDLSKETGKKWRVIGRKIIPYTGPLWEPPGNPVQIECLLTTKPKSKE